MHKPPKTAKPKKRRIYLHHPYGNIEIVPTKRTLNIIQPKVRL